MSPPNGYKHPNNRAARPRGARTLRAESNRAAALASSRRPGRGRGRAGRAPRRPGNNPRTRGNTRGPRYQGRQSGAFGNERIETAPASVGVNYGASFIKKNAGKVQALADYGPEEGSERVSFCDIFDSNVISGVVAAGPPVQAPGFDDEGAYNGYYTGISPSTVSPRLTQYEELYQFYAFRKLLIEYLPFCASDTAVGVNLGVLQNADDTDVEIAAPTVQQVMEFRPSMGGQAWQKMSMTYTHKGTKLWPTNSTGLDDSGPGLQALLICTLDGNPVDETSYGKIRISGIIDFYRDTPPSSTAPSIRLNKRMMRLLPDDRKKLMAAFQLAVDKEIELKKTVPILSNERERLLRTYIGKLIEEESNLAHLDHFQEIKIQGDDFVHLTPHFVPTTIANNNGVIKINPQIDENYDSFPKSESFINAVKELVIKRSSLSK
jgi:hypothetical protein